MKIVGCDLHARQQSVAVLDTETGELTERTFQHQGEQPRAFYASLDRPVLVGIEASGAMQGFLEIMDELQIDCRVGHPAKIRTAETRKQKHDRRDALLLLQLLVEKRFPTIRMPTIAQRDLQTLLRDRHQWVRMRTRVQSTLQAIALNHGLRKSWVSASHVTACSFPRAEQFTPVRAGFKGPAIQTAPLPGRCLAGICRLFAGGCEAVPGLRKLETEPGGEEFTAVVGGNTTASSAHIVIVA